jgi:SAM-dependent methyltransferase
MARPSLAHLGESVSRRLFVPGPLDFVFNPVWLIRRPVYKFLKHNSDRVTGNTLDFGCGSMPYRHLFTRATAYTGLDLESSEHGLSKPDVVFDGITIPFPDATFDSVVMFEVLDDLADPAIQLQEIRRVLTPGGTLLMTTSFVWELHEEPHDIARYTHHGLIALLEANGFTVELQKNEGHYVRTLGQLNAMYWYQILQKLSWTFVIGQTLHRLPFGLVLGVGIAALIQLLTVSLENLLPKRRELYLSNLVFSRKAE